MISNRPTAPSDTEVRIPKASCCLVLNTPLQPPRLRHQADLADRLRLRAGWNTYGGISASAPTIASVHALAGIPSSGNHPAKFPYTAAGTSALNDVTSGNNGTCATGYLCTAQSGYDGPTDWGTPRAWRPSPADRAHCFAGHRPRRHRPPGPCPVPRPLT